MADKFCQKCNSPMAFKSGTNQEGKAWKGWFCPDRSCGVVQWVHDQKQAGKVAVPGADAGYKAMVMAYAKDLVVARLASGEKIERPAKSTIETFRLLFREYSNPYSTPLKEKEAEPEEREDYDAPAE